jgi:hypothetical protein
MKYLNNILNFQFITIFSLLYVYIYANQDKVKNYKKIQSEDYVRLT